MAGDVYGAEPYTGQGGWSWYTGAAGLMHRAAVEALFGLSMGAHHLSFEPCLPSHWQQAELTLRRAGKTLHFMLLRIEPENALQAAALQQATLLGVGEALPWLTLPESSRHLIALPVSGSMA